MSVRSQLIFNISSKHFDPWCVTKHDKQCNGEKRGKVDS